MRRTVLPILLLTACGSSPSAPDRPDRTDRTSDRCRVYPTLVREDDVELPCVLERNGSVTLRCSDGVTASSWTYASVVDFVTEARIPNKFLRIAASTATPGTPHRAPKAITAAYSYDAQGRLAERRRARLEGGVFVPLDRTEFTRWDNLGRPTLGFLATREGALPMEATYDDRSRAVSWSNTDEEHGTDAEGNTVEEVWFILTASGERSWDGRRYRLLRTDQLCF